MGKNIYSFFSQFVGPFLSPDVGIDLGTANTVVLLRGQGIVMQEPSVVARRTATGELIAVGQEAKHMLGKTPKGLEAIRPLRRGVIADVDATEAMLELYIRRILQPYPLAQLVKPTVVIGIPSEVTEVERRAVSAAALHAGAGRVFLIEEPMAAAIGAGLQVMEPQGRMIVDMGGGTTEIAVISLGGIVLNRSIPLAGDVLDEAIVEFVRARYGVLIGETTAEQTKIAIGSAFPFEGEGKKRVFQHVVRGRKLDSGMPTSVKIHSVELREALASVVQHIVLTIRETLEETPPELVSDILEHGIALAGGSSQLRGFDACIAEETKMPVWMTKDPQRAVARGCGVILDSPELIKRVTVKK